MVMPLVEENLSGLVDTYRMSSYFSSAQNLVTSFQHTGALARNSLYAGYGSPAKKSGECRGNSVRRAASLDAIAIRHMRAICRITTVST